MACLPCTPTFTIAASSKADMKPSGAPNATGTCKKQGAEKDQKRLRQMIFFYFGIITQGQKDQYLIKVAWIESFLLESDWFNCVTVCHGVSRSFPTMSSKYLLNCPFVTVCHGLSRTLGYLSFSQNLRSDYLGGFPQQKLVSEVTKVSHADASSKTTLTPEAY